MVNYLSEGNIYEYSLQKWSSQKIPILSDGLITQAVLSSDKNWIAFEDGFGLKLVESPFTEEPMKVLERISRDWIFIF